MTILNSKYFFNSSEKAIELCDNLSHLTAVSKALGSQRLRRSNIEMLKNFALELIRTPEAKNLDQIKRDLIEINPKVSKFYPLSSSEKVTDIAHRILKDLNSVIQIPIKKSKQGKNGPTFLINYPVLDSLSNLQTNIESYVIKWTHMREIASNRIYQAFSTQFQANGYAGFKTPKTCEFHRSDASFTKSNLSIENLSNELNTHFQQLLEKIVKIQGERLSDDRAEILFSERISGENILDFVLNRYTNLEQYQKERFFHFIGRISFLDLIIGNHERFIAIEMEESGPNLFSTELEANLGNAMIQWEENLENPRFYLYAIDNGIDKFLISSSNERIEYSVKFQREKYLQFLNFVFSSQNPFCLIAKNIKQSLNNSSEIHSKYEQFSILQKDLETFGFKFLESGLKEMKNILKNDLIPTFESERGIELRNYLQIKLPGIYLPLQERLNLFKNYF